MALELLPLPSVDFSDPISVRMNQRAAELNFKRIVTWSEAGVLNGAGTASRLSYWTDSDTLAAVSDLTSFIAGSGAVSVANDGDGTVTISVSSTVLTDAVILAPASSARNVVQPTGAAVIPMILKGATSQSANLLEFQNSSGTVLANFEAAGNLALSRSDAAAVSLGLTNSGAGDSMISLTAGAATWSGGVDNSDSDAFVVSESSTLGTNNNLKIAVGGATSILRGDLDVTRAQASGAVGLTIENTSATDATASLYLKTTGADHAQQIKFSGTGSNTWTIVRDGRFTNDMLAFHNQTSSASAILTLDGVAGVAIGLGTNSAPSEKLHVYHASNSALSILVQNAGNGSSAHAYLNLMSSHSSADNAIRFSSGTPASYDVDWMIGEDASDSNAFVLSYVNTFMGGSLGTNNRLKIATGGGVTIPNLAGTASRVVVADSNGLLSASFGAYLARALSNNTTSVGNVGAGEDDLMTYTVVGGTLAASGDSIYAECSGTFAATTVRLRAYFGSDLLFDTGSLVLGSAADWGLEIRIIRTGATTQKATVKFQSAFASLSSYCDYTTPGRTLASDNVLKLTGEATSNNDIVQEAMLVDFRSAA